jgi:L-alanine-DL-glutamate epimerase-like enolase superfamily enzyme
VKVERLRCFATNLPLSTGRYEMSHGRSHEATVTTIVELTAADRTLGYGEVCTMGATYIEGFAGAVHTTLRELVPTVLASNALEPGPLDRRINEAVRGHLPGKAARLRDVAHDLGLKAIIDEPMGGEIAVAGIVHLAASCDQDAFLAASHVTESHINRDAQPWVLNGQLQMHDGLVSLSGKPGPGITVDPNRLGEPLIDAANGRQ